MNEERMRELYARHTALRAASDPPCEVSLDAMIDVLEHHGSEDHRREIMAQILRSPACREEFELLRALVRAGEEAEPPEWNWSIRLTLTQWRLAAAVFLVLGVGLIIGIVRRGGSDLLRGGRPSIELLDPQDEVRVRSLSNFTWSSVSGALGYRVQIFSESGEILFSSAGLDTVALVPSEIQVVPGRYLWNVTAQLPGGGTLNSPTHGVILAP